MFIPVPGGTPGTAHRTAVLVSGVLLLLVVAANVPTLLLLSATRAGTERTRTLIRLITAWSGTVTAPAQPPPRRTRRPAPGRRQADTRTTT